MRVIADFLIVLGVMVVTGTGWIMLAAIGRVDPTQNGLWALTILLSMLGAAMVTAGVLVHLRKWQGD